MFSNFPARHELLFHHTVLLDHIACTFFSLLSGENQTALIFTGAPAQPAPTKNTLRGVMKAGLSLQRPAEKLRLDEKEIFFDSTVTYPADHPISAELCRHYREIGLLADGETPSFSVAYGKGNIDLPASPKKVTLSFAPFEEEILVEFAFLPEEGKTYSFPLPEGEGSFAIHRILEAEGIVTLFYTADYRLNFFSQAQLNAEYKTAPTPKVVLLREKELQKYQSCSFPADLSGSPVCELFSLVWPREREWAELTPQESDPPCRR